MNSSKSRIHQKDWLWLGALAVLWGGSFFFNDIILKELPPLTLVFLRVALAACLLLPLLWIRNIDLPHGLSAWKPLVLVAIFNNVVPFSLIVMGQRFIPSGLASILNATTPLFTVVVMLVAGEESPEAHRIAGVIAGLIGVVILRGDGDLASAQAIGIVLCLAASFSYGVAALVARRRLSASPPLQTAACQLLASSAMMAVIASAFEQPWRLPIPGPVTWLAVLGLATLSTALAYLVFFQILRRSGATNVMLVTLLIPVTAVLLGYLILGERVSAREIVGSLVIGSALLVIDGRVIRLVRP
ncbi:DMT family transporter [Bradyrhizobium sp. ARR65]|uniref:DMT family transporter n=1 Tax=Bradyrhizobium sp. ARR65 TaxID=1040989 RepID=UPI000466D566|nr:DMT family transporter [Bradyrhizobium sp. ARR65]